MTFAAACMGIPMVGGVQNGPRGSDEQVDVSRDVNRDWRRDS